MSHQEINKKDNNQMTQRGLRFRKEISQNEAATKKIENL